MSEHDSEWRAGKTVLVTEAQTNGSLAVIRSLGRAGYRVLASSTQADALGFYSRYCARGILEPSQAVEFDAWLSALVESESIDLIIPSEGFLLALRPHFANYRRLLPVPEDESHAYAGLSKCDLFRSCVSKGMSEGLPAHLLLVTGASMPSDETLKALGLPLFLKVDAVYARCSGGSKVLRCDTAAAALDAIPQLLVDYQQVLVQGYVRGAGVGAFIARWRGVQLCEFMHRRIHEVPHTGGHSSFRRSWRDSRIMADANARMDCIGWQGVGMFEYRWDSDSGNFYLLEFNSRFWGSLHLALFAGVDFPLHLADAFFGHAQQVGFDRDPNVLARQTFPGEVSYVLSCLKDAALPLRKRLWPMLEFMMLGLDPRVRSDLLFPGDRVLYIRAMFRSIRDFLRRQ